MRAKLIVVTLTIIASLVLFAQLPPPPVTCPPGATCVPPTQIVPTPTPLPTPTPTPIPTPAPQTHAWAAPSVAIYQVTASTPNSFAPPPNTSICPIVTRNLPMAFGLDYNMVNGNVVFAITPNVGDNVQLICW